MTQYKVEYLTLSGGKVIAAYKLVCPDCHKLDLESEIDTETTPWTAWCRQGHEFRVDPTPDA